MRVRQPEIFDKTREYKPGERCLYRGMILIAEVWDKWCQKFSNENPQQYPPRCIRCRIKREDCPGIGVLCDKYRRSDKKTIYWRFLRVAKGYRVKRRFITEPFLMVDYEIEKKE